jgi:hypothetical protein
LHERSAARRDQRNGTRMRGLNTRAGSLDWAGPGFVDTMIGLKARSGRMVIHGRAKTEVSA